MSLKAKTGLHTQSLWQYYEQVAMHFNDLILRLRIQALGGVAAVSTLLGLLDKNEHVSWLIVNFTFFFLCIAWIAIWILDFNYYSRLLSGAIKAIIELENNSESQNPPIAITLSKHIHQSVLSGNEPHFGAARIWFYGLIFTALFIGLVFSSIQSGLFGNIVAFLCQITHAK